MCYDVAHDVMYTVGLLCVTTYGMMYDVIDGLIHSITYQRLDGAPREELARPIWPNMAPRGPQRGQDDLQDCAR